MKIGEVSYYTLPKKEQDKHMNNIFKGTAKKKSYWDRWTYYIWAFLC